MSNLSEAIGHLVAFFKLQNVPYMLVGGLANLVWGEPRSTMDVDITFSLHEEGLEEFLGHVNTIVDNRVSSPLKFLKDNRVLPVCEKRTGVNVDLILATLPYETAAIERAKCTKWGNQRFRVCTAEDLIIHKIISMREKDFTDVRQIIRRNASTLDRKYLDPKVKELSEAFARPDMLKGYLESFKNRPT